MEHRGTQRPVVLEPAPRHPRREHQLVGDPPTVGRDQHRVLVDRDDPLALADLLLDEVGEQVAAHRLGRVGAEPLALAGDRRRDEVERVQLGVGVRQRCPRLASLVDDQVQAGRVGVRAHPLAPHLHCEQDLLDAQLAERDHGLGRIDDHLVRAARGA